MLAVPVGKHLPQEVGHEHLFCSQTLRRCPHQPARGTTAARIGAARLSGPRSCQLSLVTALLASLLQGSHCNGALFISRDGKGKGGKYPFTKNFTPAARLFSSTSSQVWPVLNTKCILSKHRRRGPTRLGDLRRLTPTRSATRHYLPEPLPSDSGMLDPDGKGWERRPGSDRSRRAPSFARESASWAFSVLGR